MKLYCGWEVRQPCLSVIAISYSNLVHNNGDKCIVVQFLNIVQKW